MQTDCAHIYFKKQLFVWTSTEGRLNSLRPSVWLKLFFFSSRLVIYQELYLIAMQQRWRVFTNVNRKSYSADTLFLLPVLFVLTLFPFPSVSQRTASAVFPPSRPFPNPINSSCFAGQNNRLHAFPFMHSWHQAETSPPTACYYLTHAPVCLLYVNKVAPRHTHTCKHTLTHPYTPLSTMFLFWNNHNKRQTSIFHIPVSLHLSNCQKMTVEMMCKMFQCFQLHALTDELLNLTWKLFNYSLFKAHSHIHHSVFFTSCISCVHATHTFTIPGGLFTLIPGFGVMALVSGTLLVVRKKLRRHALVELLVHICHGDKLVFANPCSSIQYVIKLLQHCHAATAVACVFILSSSQRSLLSLSLSLPICPALYLLKGGNQTQWRLEVSRWISESNSAGQTRLHSRVFATWHKLTRLICCYK